jgi:hypothetical protein
VTIAGVPHPIRLVLPALVLACAGLVLTPTAAQACKCQVPSVAQASRQADVVFTGLMLGQQRAGREIDLAFEVDRIYKGEVLSDTVDITSPTDSCGLKLTEDQSYVVFAVDNRSRLVSEECYGTTRARSREVAAVEKALGPGESFQPPAPEPVPPTYTKVHDDDVPPEFLRVAAPGAAMVLVGLLGWLVVRRRA